MLSAHEKNTLAEMENDLRAHAHWLNIYLKCGNALLGRPGVLRDRLLLVAVLLAAVALGAILSVA